MDIKMKENLGRLDVSDQAIKTIVGKATTESYGVVKMSSQHQIKDNFDELLKNENFNRGVQILNKDNKLSINIFIVASYGSKVPEIAKSIQGNVAFQLKAMLGVKPTNINVVITDVNVVKNKKSKSEK